MSAFANIDATTIRVLIASAIALAQATYAQAQMQDDRDTTGESAASDVASSSTTQSTHVAPPAPEHTMPEMSGRTMIDTMDMDDSAPIATFNVDRLERFDGGDGVGTSWKASASFGGDFDKAWLRSEGDATRGSIDHADVEALWGHAIASYWDAQVGVRHDFGRGSERNWVAFGVQGLAPYWFEVGATAYVGSDAHLAARLEADWDLAIGQRLVIQPRVEANVYPDSDRVSSTEPDLSNVVLGVRVRYEIRRELAPYIGIEQIWSRTIEMGGYRDYSKRSDTRWVAGLRFWY